MCSNMGGRAAPAATPQAAPAVIQQPAPAAQQAAAPAPVTYGRMPMSEVAYMARQNFNAATQAAIQTYLQAHAAPGSLALPGRFLT